jgi:hypothetical protein
MVHTVRSQLKGEILVLKFQRKKVPSFKVVSGSSIMIFAKSHVAADFSAPNKINQHCHLLSDNTLLVTLIMRQVPA